MLYKNALLVKIVSYSSRLYWYSDKIGQEYWVVKEVSNINENFKYSVIYPIDNKDNSKKWLNVNDIEIIKTSDIEVREIVTHTLTEYPKNKLYIVVGGKISKNHIRELYRTTNKIEADKVAEDMVKDGVYSIDIIEVDLEYELHNRNRQKDSN